MPSDWSTLLNLQPPTGLLPPDPDADSIDPDLTLTGAMDAPRSPISFLPWPLISPRSPSWADPSLLPMPLIIVPDSGAHPSPLQAADASDSPPMPLIIPPDTSGSSGQQEPGSLASGDAFGNFAGGMNAASPSSVPAGILTPGWTPSSLAPSQLPSPDQLPLLWPGTGGAAFGGSSTPGLGGGLLSPPGTSLPDDAAFRTFDNAFNGPMNLGASGSSSYDASNGWSELGPVPRPRGILEPDFYSFRTGALGEESDDDILKRAAAVYGETAGLRPQLINPNGGVNDPNNWDPNSAAILHEARTNLASMFGTVNNKMKSKMPDDFSNPIQMRQWDLAMDAARDSLNTNLDPRLGRMWMRQEGVGDQQYKPWVREGFSPLQQMGPFVNTIPASPAILQAGTAIAKGPRAYIDFYGR